MKTTIAVLRFACAAFVLLSASSSIAQSESAIKNVFWQPDELQSGSVVFFTVESNRNAIKVTGSFLGKDLLFFRDDKPKLWYALAGVDVETTPGTYDLAVRAVLPGRRVARALKKVDISEAHFKSGTVDVPENFVNPDEASKKQIAADQVLKDRAFAHLIPTPQWSGDFVKPVDAPPTDSFGMTRVLNEEMTSEHRGTDFPIKEGSPVSASNSGTVVLAHELFYEGNCVVLDHGQHFFTIYMHLSKIQVRQGLKVRKGQRLGLSGATGRVTGPHLHMGVRWEGAYVDPLKLLALTLPETHRVARTTPATRRR
jgi:murein DD-endopeptidase MepM/ murein hydrolase activator NlpD